MNSNFGQIQNNCQYIYDFPICNLVSANNTIQVGFSSLNLPFKVFKLCGDWWTNYQTYQKVEETVTSTLEGIQQELQDSEKCPIFFFINKKGSAITYEELAQRVLTSKTLKNSEKVQALAKKVLNLYQNHPFGFTSYQIEHDKKTLVSKVKSDAQWRYSDTGLNDDWYKLTKCLEGQDYIMPKDPLSYEEMKKYLEGRVKQINPNR